MAIERWRPFGVLTEREPFRDIQSEVNRLWMPVVDMYETNDDLVLDFEIPGVREKDISLSITGDLLTVRGERQFRQELKDDHTYYIERAYGKFERSVQLPMPVQAGRVTATFRDGVLEVRLPKAEEVRPKEIKIDVL